MSSKQEEILLRNSFITLGLISTIGYSYVSITKDYEIQTSTNLENTYGIASMLGRNVDGVLVIDTNILNYINNFSDPLNDRYYTNHNAISYIRNFSDLELCDNLSFETVLLDEGYKLLMLDDNLYSYTGNITKIEYKNESVNGVKYEASVFDMEQLENYIKNIDESLKLSDIKVSFNNVKTFEEIPTLVQNRKNKKVKLKEQKEYLNKISK